MTTHFTFISSVLTVSLAALFFFPVAHVDADAWWGKGYKPPAWVKANGGTIIRANIVGKKSNHYKGILKRNGKYVEVEFGKNMLFDDAKNGIYTVTFYNCHKDCRYQETDNKKHIRDHDKKEATVSVAARPGQEIRITFDTASKKAWIASGGGRITPTKPKLTFAQQVEIVAQKEQGKALLLDTQLLSTRSSHENDTQEILTSQTL